MLYTSYEIYQITKNKQGGKGMFKKVVSAIMVAAMVGTMVAPVSVSAKDGGKTIELWTCWTEGADTEKASQEMIQKWEEETGNTVKDGIATIYLNAHGRNRTDIPDELLQFLDYVKNTGRNETIVSTDSFVRHIQENIDKIKQNRSMEERYMLLEEMMRNEKREGNIEGKQEFLLDFLESRFTVPSELREKISAETNPNKLKLWFQLSRNVSSLEEFRNNM